MVGEEGEAWREGGREKKKKWCLGLDIIHVSRYTHGHILAHAIDLWNSKYGSCSLRTDWGRAPLGLSLPGPGSLLAHLPVPALPPLGVCPGEGALARPVVYRKLSSATCLYARRLATFAEMRNVTCTFCLGCILAIFWEVGRQRDWID